MSSWQVQDAEARFGELLAASLAEGPQVVTCDGIDTAVLVPIEQWRQLQTQDAPYDEGARDLKDWLLAPEPRTETLVPPRPGFRLRSPPRFD